MSREVSLPGGKAGSFPELSEQAASQAEVVISALLEKRSALAADLAVAEDTVTCLRRQITVMNPIEVGHGFRREVGDCSGMKPAIIPR